VLKHIIFVASLFLCILGFSRAYAADGKELFMSKCGQCHKSGGEAAAFAPTKYASVQWERFFSRNKHASVKDISAQCSESDIDAVKAYLVKHAADSDQPEAVGLR